MQATGWKRTFEVNKYFGQIYNSLCVPIHFEIFTFLSFHFEIIYFSVFGKQK